MKTISEAHKRAIGIANTKHGMYTTRTYASWAHMIQRCSNPNVWNYKRYGGVGIKVCKRWSKFINFYADMGKRPAGKSIDRINPYGNYTPKNCKWSTPTEQNRNYRKKIHKK